LRKVDPSRSSIWAMAPISHGDKEKLPLMVYGHRWQANPG